MTVPQDDNLLDEILSRDLQNTKQEF